MKKILIVEDDELIAELEKDYLEASNYETIVVNNGEDGLNYALNEDIDLVLLDIMLPKMNGFDVCKKIREVKDISIILVTAKKEDIDKIRGLGLGADDYIVKPFSPSELIARVKAHISIHERLLNKSKENNEIDEQDREINIKELRILPMSRKVFVNDKEVFLKNKEFELLLFLVKNPNIVFSKQTLFDRVWDMDGIGDTSTVTVHINRIREKIEDESKNIKFIDTVWGAGYRFRV
ncbi:response regulator transcription factor [Intestinibacter sp.]|uniref:response regulator transcription factor n=1 Tax=Intestinibacter sp. TaxID=1965304 RepID=UPI003F138BE1